MGRIVAGIGTSHVPSIGGAYDRGRTQTPAWKPLFDAYVPVPGYHFFTRVLPSRDKQALRRLQDAVAARSAELGLPDGLLASQALHDTGRDHDLSSVVERPDQ